MRFEKMKKKNALKKYHCLRIPSLKISEIAIQSYLRNNAEKRGKISKKQTKKERQEKILQSLQGLQHLGTSDYFKTKSFEKYWAIQTETCQKAPFSLQYCRPLFNFED